MGPHISKIAKAGGGTADEAALLRLKHTQHALHHRRVKQYIVVQVVDIGSRTLLEQEVALLCKTIARQVVMQLHAMPMPLQGL